MPHYLVFLTHIALALQLLAFVAGFLLVAKACTEGFFCKKSGKVVGVIVMIIAFASIVCISYLSFVAKKDYPFGHKRPGMRGMKWHPPIEGQIGKPAGKPVEKPAD